MSGDQTNETKRYRKNLKFTVSTKHPGDCGCEAPFITLFVELFAKSGGGGNVVSCDGCDIVTPVAQLVTYIGLVAYIVCGWAKSIWKNKT